MLKAVRIKDELFYVGVNDRSSHLFEGLWPLPKGVAYNSYLLRDDKTVLFDTVEICFSDIFFQKLESALNGKKLDYLVINHMEPDHSSSIGLLRMKYPEVQIIGNPRTLDMVKGFYYITENVKSIKEGFELNTGKHVLRFYMTPMIHWPETMMTYDLVDKTIFTGDAFGAFGALDGGITDTTLRYEKYWKEMIRYYSNIVGKYGSPVQKAIQKLSSIEINMICSTHGPVWTTKENIKHVIELYDRMSRYDADPGVVIAYGSMYGHTELMAELIASELSAQGIMDIAMYNLSQRHISYVLRDIFKFKGLIIGSPTYNNGLFPMVELLLSKVGGSEIKNHLLGFFGSYTWAGAAVRHLKNFAEQMSDCEIVYDPVEMKQSPDQSTIDSCIALARAMANKLKVL